MFDEHQRIAMDWWLYIHTEQPTPPLELAQQQDFGRVGEQSARTAWAKEELHRRGHLDGRPATYDTDIDAVWNPSIGVRKAWVGRRKIHTKCPLTHKVALVRYGVTHPIAAAR